MLTIASGLGYETVEILVGLREPIQPDKITQPDRIFKVHRDLLFAKCDYMRKSVFQAGPGKRSLIDLGLEDIGTVSLLVNFLYKDVVPTAEEYIANKKGRELAKNGALPVPSFSVLRQPRPVAFGQNSPMAFGQPENNRPFPYGFGSFGSSFQSGIPAPSTVSRSTP